MAVQEWTKLNLHSNEVRVHLPYIIYRVTTHSQGKCNFKQNGINSYLSYCLGIIKQPVP
jgi:hypothetical protein